MLHQNLSYGFPLMSMLRLVLYYYSLVMMSLMYMMDMQQLFSLHLQPFLFELLLGFLMNILNSHLLNSLILNNHLMIHYINLFYMLNTLQSLNPQYFDLQHLNNIFEYCHTLLCFLYITLLYNSSLYYINLIHNLLQILQYYQLYYILFLYCCL